MDRFLEALDAVIHSMSELCNEWEQIEADLNDELSADCPFDVDAVHFVLLLIEWRENLNAMSSRPN